VCVWERERIPSVLDLRYANYPSFFFVCVCLEKKTNDKTFFTVKTCASILGAVVTTAIKRCNVARSFQMCNLCWDVSFIALLLDVRGGGSVPTPFPSSEVKVCSLEMKLSQ